MTREELAQRIKTTCLHMRDDRPIARDGTFLNWLIDLRPLLLRQDALNLIAGAFWEHFRDIGPFQVGTVETAGIPILAAIILHAPPAHAGLNAFIVRKSRKTDGMGQAIDGYIDANPIVFVDDILNSGRSLEKARSLLVDSGKAILHVFAVIDYESSAGLNWRNQYSIQVTSLFLLSKFGQSLKKAAHLPTRQYKELWRTGVAGGFPYYVVPKSAPVLVGDRIFRGCDAGLMHAFDVDTGKVIWEHEAKGAHPRKGIWSTPAVHEGRLYYGAYNGVFYALDSRDGSEVWSQSCCEWIGASPLVLPNHGVVLIGLEYARPWAKGTLTAFGLTNGAKVWEHLVKKFQHGSAAYWQGGDLVIWSSADHFTYAMRPDTGEIVWSFPTRRSVKYAAAIDEVHALIAIASFDKSIYLLDAATGSLLGEWATEEICYTTPLFSHGKLFCGSGDRHLYVIDVAARQLVKRIEFDGRIYGSPQVQGDSVFFGTAGGQVIELDAISLNVIGRILLPDAVTNEVVLHSDKRRLFVSTYMNHLFAIERL